MITTRQYKEEDFYADDEMIQAIHLETGDVVRLAGDKLIWIDEVYFDDRIDTEEEDANEVLEADEPYSEIIAENTYVCIYVETYDTQARQLKGLEIEKIPGDALITAYKLIKKIHQE